jgi:hypothetical protein
LLDGPAQDLMRKNALRAAQIFSVDRLGMLMKQTLGDVSRLKKVGNILPQANSVASTRE